MTDKPDAKQVSRNLLHLEQFDWPHLSVAVCGKPALRGEVIKRLAEQLEEDAAKGVCEYAEAERKPGTINAHTCDGCRFDNDEFGPSCEMQMARDIIRRAKALAGVEVE